MKEPAYRDLPTAPGTSIPCSWGVFGADDEIGTINRLGEEQARLARDEVVLGRSFCLSLPLDMFEEGVAGRRTYRHTIFSRHHFSQDDVLDNFYPQNSTQWDGLRHHRIPKVAFYNGVSAEEAGAGGERLGIDRWAARGIVGRGVLADVAGLLEEEGAPLDPAGTYEIRPELIQRALARGGVEVRYGDILMVRTGVAGDYLRRLASGRPVGFSGEWTNPGLYGGKETAEYLWDAGFAAVVADNVAVEAAPVTARETFLHRWLIPALGFAVGELFALDELAAFARETGRHSCLFMSAPLRIPGGVGSPANALALV